MKGDGVYKYLPFGGSADKNRGKVIYWIELLYKTKEYWNNGEDYIRFELDSLPTDIGCVRMENRKKYIG